MLITNQQAAEYLRGMGVNLPGFLLEMLLEQVSTIEDCLTENYNPTTGKLITLYLLSLLGFAQGDRYVTSERAPSGASRSYQFRTLVERWNGQLNLLRSLDSQGCANSLIPQDPNATVSGALFVARGGCHT